MWREHYQAHQARCLVSRSKNSQCVGPVNRSGKRTGPISRSPTIPAQTFIENVVWCLASWMVCGFSCAQICTLWKLKIPFRVNIASSVNNSFHRNCGFRTHCSKHHWQNVTRRGKSSSLRPCTRCRYGYSRSSCSILQTVLRWTPSAEDILRVLVPGVSGYVGKNSLLLLYSSGSPRPSSFNYGNECASFPQTLRCARKCSAAWKSTVRKCFLIQTSCLKCIAVGTTVEEVDVCHLGKRVVFGLRHESNTRNHFNCSELSTSSDCL